MRKIKKKTILLFILALVTLYTIIYIVPTVSGAMVSSYVAEYGQLKIYDEATAWFVRNEKVYLADTTGDTNYFFEEGSLVRKDGKIMEITENSKTDDTDEEGNPIGPDDVYSGVLERLGEDAIVKGDYRIEDVGMISYYADGFEGLLTPKTMEEKDYTYFQQISQEAVLPLERKSAIAGEPVFKVVDRTKWYMVCFVDIDHLERYEAGSKVKVEFEDGSVDAYVDSVSESGDKAKVILYTDYYYEQFAALRVAEVSLVTYDESGVIIENSSITEKKGQKGVYVKNKSDDYFFVPIMVYATDGEQSLIADDFYYDTEKDGEMVMTVEVYDEILKNAES